MKNAHHFLSLFSIFFVFNVIQSVQSAPLIVLPPYFTFQRENTITVINDPPTDIAIYVEQATGKTKLSGNLQDFTFHAASNSFSIATVTIKEKGSTILQKKIPVIPDLYSVHIHIDKPIYRSGETVNVRILPLTYRGSIYTGELDIFLVNNEGFKETSTIKRRKVEENEQIIAEKFEIPVHTFYGDWKILVKAVDDKRDSILKEPFKKEFQVLSYELPNYRLSGFLNDSAEIDQTPITLEAKYFHGRPVNGSVFVYCRKKYALDHERSNWIHVGSGEFENGVWSKNLNLLKCDPFSNQKEIFVESRENGTGQRQELTFAWDVTLPKFTLTAVKPYFTKDTLNIILNIDGDGISHGNVKIILECFTLGPSRIKNENVEVMSKIGDVIRIDIPKEWRTHKSSVLRVTAKREIRHGWSNETMLYIPNLTNTTLNTLLINPEQPKAYYKDGEEMRILVGGDDYFQRNFLVVCNSQTVHRIKVASKDVRNNTLKVAINDKMDGNCILTSFSNDKSSVDVLLFRVEKSCKDCTVQVSRIKNDQLQPIKPTDKIEPGESISLDFKSDSNSIVFYRAMDERLNYISLGNDDFEFIYQDYLITNPISTGVRIINLVDENKMNEEMKKVCSLAGVNLRMNCKQGARSVSLVSEKCLKFILTECLAQKQPLPITSHSATSKVTHKVGKAHLNWSEMLFTLRKEKTEPIDSSPFVQDFSSQPMEFNDPEITQKMPKIRKHFPETWLFDAIVLGRNGSGSVQSTSPDNVGQWTFTSSFWRPGKVGLFQQQPILLQTTKPIFLEMEIPRTVYVNETISPLITATAIDLQKPGESFVFCLEDLPRDVCVDQGANGEKGKTHYIKIELTRDRPIQSKYFMMKFLTAKPVTVFITLRERNCKTGNIVDSIRRNVDVQIRADSEEYYGRHILYPQKPVLASLNNHKEMNGDASESFNMIEFSDKHASSDGFDTINTLITSNIPDTEHIYYFSLSFAKFLPGNDRITHKYTNRYSRNRPSYLPNVFKDLAVALYDYKIMRMESKISYKLEAEISDLINEMMNYSNCTSKKELCGYSEFEKPQENGKFSILLTSIATSLLCEADAEPARVVGSLKAIANFIPKLSENEFDEDLSDIIDVENKDDKKYILVSFIYQVSRDCAAYKSEVPDMSKNFGKLHKYFYELDESNLKDGRTSAAIAFMSTNATAEIMRSDMISRIDLNQMPFWKCNSIELNRVKKPQLMIDSLRRRRESCQVMINSFALSAIVTAYAEGKVIDWDSLADWISEQKRKDGTFGSPLTTVVAARSLYEKKRRTVEIGLNQHLEVSISWKGGSEKRINITEHAVEIHIPTNVRNVVLITKGTGKGVVAARIVATKRARPKRGLTQDDYYPVHFSIKQSVLKTFVYQTVCFHVTNPAIKTLDLFHGVYTSFSTSPDKLNLLNSTYQKINVATSALGLHFIMTDIVANQTICYELILSEMKGHRGTITPAASAPVPIRATHPVLGLVGMLLIAHPDVQQAQLLKRKKREIEIRRRFVRRITDETVVDTVCFKGGECACAENSCNVECGLCRLDSFDDLKYFLKKKKTFGIRFNIIGISNEQINDAQYFIYEGIVKDSKFNEVNLFEQVLDKKIRVWLRACNVGCNPSSVQVGSDYYILGSQDGFKFDEKYNYILSHSDRFEKSSDECRDLHSAITIQA